MFVRVEIGTIKQTDGVAALTKQGAESPETEMIGPSNGHPTVVHLIRLPCQTKAQIVMTRRREGPCTFARV